MCLLPTFKLVSPFLLLSPSGPLNYSIQHSLESLSVGTNLCSLNVKWVLGSGSSLHFPGNPPYSQKEVLLVLFFIFV